MVTASEPGERLLLTGTVYADDGKTPVPGAHLRIFHTDASGLYSPNVSNDVGEQRARLKVELSTNPQGHYEVRTIKPGPYPGGKNQAHIHIIVSAPGFAEANATTSFAGDPNLTREDYQRHAQAGAFSSIRPLERAPDGGWKTTRDIRLQRAGGEARSYVIDRARSRVSFEIRHGIRQATGTFQQFDARLSLVGAAIERSHVAFTLQAASILTDNTERDEHLRTPDFFDVARYPTITFVSTAVKAVAPDRYEVTGALALRGVSKTLVLPVTIAGLGQPSANALTFTTTTLLNRRDFGMVWNRVVDRGGILLANEVTLTITVGMRAADQE
ncbi:MAG: YceI family protein, partial [Burkholderiales bacterium]